MRVVLALVLLFTPLFAAVTRLYLKDGSYQIVREWKQDGDRIRFYSTERSQWEEIPTAMVDLDKTSAEISARKAKVDEEAKEVSDEDKAVRAQQNEILKIPQDAGVYTLDDKNSLTILKQADIEVHTNKGRSVLKAVTPMPLVTGKATVEIPQDQSTNIVKDPDQVFYFQLSKDERFAIIRLTPRHGVRIAERLTIAPVVNETDEEVDELPSFKKQLTDGGLYKIWPEKPMEPGQYAVIEYTPGKVQPLIWDFAVKK